MTDLQKVELDILKSVIAACDRLNIKYYLVCGSALGAVKYNGFIPWDDDVDIALTREDYNIFVRCAQDYLPENLFLQTDDTDTEYFQIFCKVRNSNTTFIEKTVKNYDINHGVYIDVFPLDGYPEKQREMTALERRKKLLRLKLLCAYQPQKNSKFKTRLFVKVGKILGYARRKKKYAKAMTAAISQYSTATSKIWCNHGNWQGKLEYAPREQYGDGEWTTFEGMRVRIPAKYDEYLTQKYGNWRADLPLEQQVGHHYAEVIDSNRSFANYVVKKKRGKIRLKTADELLALGITAPSGYLG